MCDDKIRCAYLCFSSGNRRFEYKGNFQANLNYKVKYNQG